MLGGNEISPAGVDGVAGVSVAASDDSGFAAAGFSAGGSVVSGFRDAGAALLGATDWTAGSTKAVVSRLGTESFTSASHPLTNGNTANVSPKATRL